ncbi:MAG: LLM class flavin-dependent oxidoreductase [Dehalococcoidia bacterium]
MQRHPVTFSSFGTVGYDSFEELANVCQTLEELDFAGFYASDHLCGFGGMPPETPLMEAWTVLAGLAPLTRRLRLGVLVSGVTYRHPPMLAKIAATIDVISRGRVVLGLGAAWWPDDHKAYGFPFPRLRERQERLEEAIEIIHGLWTQDRFTYSGKHYQVTDAALAPKPVQKPRPPILIAAVGDRGLDLTARRAQMWASVSTTGFAQTCIQRITDRCRAYGRDPGEITFSQLFTEFLPTDDARQTRTLLEERSRRLESADPQRVAIQARNALEGESSEERVLGSVLAGDPDEMRAQIQRHVDIGITHIIIMFRPPFNRTLVERFRRDVMSAFID